MLVDSQTTKHPAAFDLNMSGHLPLSAVEVSHILIRCLVMRALLLPKCSQE